MRDCVRVLQNHVNVNTSSRPNVFIFMNNMTVIRRQYHYAQDIIIANGLLLTSCVKLKDTFKCGVHRTTIHFAVSLLFSSLLNVIKDTCPKNVVYRSVRLESQKPHPTPPA